MTTKFGVFQEPAYLGAGDNASKHLNSRDEGLNLKATSAKTGKNNDATFDKFVSVHESDRYIDPSRRALLANAEKAKHNITDKPFKATSPMKKSVAPGDYYGVLGGKVEAGKPLESRPALKKGDVQPQPKPIYTSPMKKGTYGMNKTTLSERQAGFKGVATEYEYQHDPDALHAQQRADAHAADLKARTSELPFKPSNPPKKGGPGMPNITISKGKGIAGEYEYVDGADPAYTRMPGDPSLSGDDGGGAPFKPASAHVTGNKWPEYYHDPEVVKMRAAADKRKAETARLASTGPWKPNQSTKTDMCRSIVRMNI